MTSVEPLTHETQFSQWKRDIEEVPTPRYVPPAPEFQNLADFLKGLSAVVSLQTAQLTPVLMQKLQSLPDCLFFQRDAAGQISRLTSTVVPSFLIIIRQKSFHKKLQQCWDYLLSQGLHLTTETANEAHLTNALAVLSWAENQPPATLKNIKTLELFYYSYIPVVRQCSPLWHNPACLEYYTRSAPTLLPK